MRTKILNNSLMEKENQVLELETYSITSSKTDKDFKSEKPGK